MRLVPSHGGTPSSHPISVAVTMRRSSCVDQWKLKPIKASGERLASSQKPLMIIILLSLYHDLMVLHGFSMFIMI